MSPLGRQILGQLRVVLAWATAAILLTPVYWMIVTIISPTSRILSRDPALLPPFTDPDFSAFARIFTARPALTWLANSLSVTTVAILLTLLAALPAGYAISRASGVLRDVVGYLLLLSLVMPATLIVIPIFQFYGELDLIDNPFAVGLAIASTTTPFSVWLMKTYFDSIPTSLEEAAAIDGASSVTTFFHVILPLSTPGIGAILAYTAIWAWADFLYSSTLLLDDAEWTLSVGIVTFIGEYAADWQGLMATGLLATLPIVAIFMLLQHFLVDGLTSGATKE